jgi:hypothetical protein
VHENVAPEKALGKKKQERNEERNALQER